MKKKMKKSITVLLTFIILLSVFTPVFAAETDISPEKETAVGEIVSEEHTTEKTASEEPTSEKQTAEEPSKEEPSSDGASKEEPSSEEKPTLPAVLPEPGSGDADGDGKITAGDSRIALRRSVNLERLPAYSYLAADVDKDGKVTAADARIILRLSVGLSRGTEKYVPKPQFFTPAITEKDVPAGAKIIYLTFDDGPSANTVKILDILKRYNVKATFFVIKNDTYSYLYKRIVDEGHSIALHSYTHDYATIYRSTDAYFSDLNKISDFVYEKAGVRTRLVRFPGGSSNTVSRSYCRGIMSTLAKMLPDKGYVYFDWNGANNDATGQNLSVAQIRSAANSYGGVSPLIMLMHDASAKSKTVEALPGIIEYYKSRGYYFLPLNENSPTAHHGIAN